MSIKVVVLHVIIVQVILFYTRDTAETHNSPLSFNTTVLNIIQSLDPLFIAYVLSFCLERLPSPAYWIVVALFMAWVVPFPITSMPFWQLLISHYHILFL